MSPEDGDRPDLRVGGWIPPIQHFAPPERRRPPAGPPAPEPAAAVTQGRPHRLPPRTRPGTLLVGAAVLSALVAAGLALSTGEKERRAAPSFVLLPTGPVMPGPVEVPSPAAAEPPPSRSAGIPTTGHRALRPPARPDRNRPPASPSPSRAALPVVGADVGLEPVGEPGRRVRHRDFRARIDSIGPGSPALDRADSGFTVRAGRARGSCVSFESDNYPGYFLRHRNFALRLDRADGSALFDADATFCPVPVAAGGFVLRSHNHPDRHLTESDSLLLLTRTPAADAQAFVTRSPLRDPVLTARTGRGFSTRTSWRSPPSAIGGLAHRGGPHRGRGKRIDGGVRRRHAHP
ncbi:AbfB domain-containing protein [Actinoplanes sp. NPDC026623]|uniref:AbfB domain-containing protein n=1 Tax=Actinoplanes sp. NPDC026623 TaxID=3155610 RepID=UPI0034026928